MLLVLDPLEHALLDQPREPVGEDVAGDPEAGVELVEATQAEQGVPHYEQGPALPHDLEGAGDGADLVVVRALEHAARLPFDGFVMKLA
jgi:hypothetical protein